MEKPAMKCDTLVIKVASRCNLNCSYCYMYNLGDKTYKSQPKQMSTRVVDDILMRTLENCTKHGVDHFSFVLHGGEPLLADKEFFIYFVTRASEVLPKTIQYRFMMQTNGILLDEEWCKLLGQLDIRIGISLDGMKEDNDKFRVDHAGRGSYDQIVSAFKLAQNSPHITTGTGLLSVININADPVKLYHHFRELNVHGLDWLLPDANYDNRPPQPTPDKAWAGETPYADWLITIFDLWFAEKNERYDVRMFYYIVHSILGGEFMADNLGQLNNEVLVIETDGGIEAVDSLKSCGEGFTKAGANVSTHSFEEAMQTRLARIYHLSHQLLPRKCLACPVREVCGGGSIYNRYSKENGFNNPSVYCGDLLKLITHIQNKVVGQLPSDILSESQVLPLTYEEALRIREEQLPLTPEPDYAMELSYQD